MRMKHVGIIGGGPGGLMTAYLLEKMADTPVRTTLFEASYRLGGKVLTPCFDRVPVRYEAGAAEFYDYAHFDDDPLKDLITELGLSRSDGRFRGHHAGPGSVQSGRHSPTPGAASSSRTDRL